MATTSADQLKIRKETLQKFQEEYKKESAELVKVQAAYGTNSPEYASQQRTVASLQKIINNLQTKIAEIEAQQSSSTSASSPTASTSSSGIPIPSLGGLAETAGSMASNLGKTAINDLASNANSLVKDMFKKAQEAIDAQKSLTTSKNDKGKQETEDKVQTLSSSENTASAPQISFAAKPVAEVMTATTNVPQDSKQGDELLRSNPQLAQTAKDLAETHKTDGSWASTLSAATSDLAKSLSTEVITPAATALKDQAKNLLSGATNLPIASALSGAGSMVKDTVSGIITAGQDLTKSITDMLPAAVGTPVGAFANSVIGQAAAMISSNKIMAYADLASKLAGNISENGLWDVVSDLAVSAPGFLLNNIDITSKLGNNTSGLVSSLVNAAKDVCPGVTDMTGLTSTQQEQLEFDTLVNLAATNGINQLLKDLLGCGKSEAGTDLNTSNTTNMLKSLLPSIAGKGDVLTLATAVSGVGSQNVAKPSQLLTTVIGNAAAEAIKTVDVKSAVNDLKNMLTGGESPANTNVTLKAEPTRSGETTKTLSALDAKNVVIMSSSNTVVIDEDIGTDDRAMTQAVFYAYS